MFINLQKCVEVVKRKQKPYKRLQNSKSVGGLWTQARNSGKNWKTPKVFRRSLEKLEKS